MSCGVAHDVSARYPIQSEFTMGRDIRLCSSLYRKVSMRNTFNQVAPANIDKTTISCYRKIHGSRPRDDTLLQGIFCPLRILFLAILSACITPSLASTLDLLLSEDPPVQCSDISMHAVGGSPPFRYSVFTEPQGSQHRTEHTLGTTTDDEMTWTVNVVAGTQVFFQVQSSDGGTLQLGGRFVKVSDDDTCLDDVPSPSSKPTFITTTIIPPMEVTPSSTSNSPPQTTDEPRTSFTATRSDTETNAPTHVSTFTAGDTSQNSSPSISKAESPSAPRPVSRSLNLSSAADSYPSSTSAREATILSTGSNPAVTVPSGSPLFPSSTHPSKVGLVVGAIAAVTTIALLCIVYWSYLCRKRHLAKVKSQSGQITGAIATLPRT